MWLRVALSSSRVAGRTRAVAANVDDGSWVDLWVGPGSAVGIMISLSAGNGGLLLALAIGRACLIPCELHSDNALWCLPHRCRPVGRDDACSSESPARTCPGGSSGCMAPGNPIVWSCHGIGAPSVLYP